MQIPVGSEVTLLEDLGDWCKIEYEGNIGYMMSNYLEYENQDGESDSVSDDDMEEIKASLEAIEEEIDRIWNLIGRG